jgi:hypothetical protein
MDDFDRWLRPRLATLTTLGPEDADSAATAKKRG